MDKWYRIDNTGKIFHAVSDATNSSVFRVSMILKENVNKDIMQKALDVVVVRFPTFMVRVRKGVFWDFMERNDEQLVVKPEMDYPCGPIDPKDNNGYLIRVLYFENRVSVEVFHSLTDGGGAIEFLKTLVFEYLKLSGRAVTADNLVISPETSPKPEEIEDSFERYATSHTVSRPGKRGEKAYQIHGTPFSTPGINVVHGVVDASELNAYAKSRGTSLTAFLTSVLIQVIHDKKMTQDMTDGIVSVALPISLRRHFPSVTMRNFFSVANVSVPMDGYIHFNDVIESVTEQLKEKTDKDVLQKGINQFVGFQSNFWMRVVPVFLKYPVMRLAFNQVGERGKTMTLSNLGNIRVPESMTPDIDRMEIILYPTRKSPINCAIGTINNQLTITFARSIEENDIIQSFFKTLRVITGIDIMVYSNDWGNSNE